MSPNFSFDNIDATVASRSTTAFDPVESADCTGAVGCGCDCSNCTTCTNQTAHTSMYQCTIP